MCSRVNDLVLCVLKWCGSDGDGSLVNSGILQLIGRLGWLNGRAQLSDSVYNQRDKRYKSGSLPPSNVNYRESIHYLNS